MLRRATENGSGRLTALYPTVSLRWGQLAVDERFKRQQWAICRCIKSSDSNIPGDVWSGPPDPACLFWPRNTVKGDRRAGRVTILLASLNTSHPSLIDNQHLINTSIPLRHHQPVIEESYNTAIGFKSGTLLGSLAKHRVVLSRINNQAYRSITCQRPRQSDPGPSNSGMSIPVHFGASVQTTCQAFWSKNTVPDTLVTLSFNGILPHHIWPRSRQL